MKNPSEVWAFVRILMVTVAVGACAGIIASVATERSLADYAQSLEASRQLPTLAEHKPTPIPGTYEEALGRVLKRAVPSVATIAKSVKDTTRGDALIGAESTLGYGAVVSADGWVLTTREALSAVKDAVRDVDVWIGSTRYAVSERRNDGATEFVLLKVDASSLSPIAFGAAPDVRSGELAFVVSDRSGILPSSIASSDAATTSLAAHAESFATTWTLANTIAISAPVVNAAGDLIGMATTGTTVEPLHHGIHAMQQIFRGTDPHYALFGAYVVDLSRALNIDPALRAGQAEGALVVANSPFVAAVPKTGPAGVAGILPHDIILDVDGEAVNAETSLAELLSTYDAGDTAHVTILRDGKTQEIAVTLGDTADLVY